LVVALVEDPETLREALDVVEPGSGDSPAVGRHSVMPPISKR